jgi:hypothetical protein
MEPSIAALLLLLEQKPPAPPVCPSLSGLSTMAPVIGRKATKTVAKKKVNFNTALTYFLAWRRKLKY